MRVEIYWVDRPGPGRVAIMPRPSGGDGLEDEIRSLREEGVEVLVSLLEPHEVEEQELARESELATAAGIEFLSHPIPDHGTPESLEATVEFVHDLEERLGAGKAVAVHCLAGIGRSATIAAAVLVAHGVPLAETLQLLAEARGFPVPETAEQLLWLEEFARRDPA
jgi:protein-tyrosine phosphatase